MQIEGPSVELAYILLRNFTNCAIDLMQPIETEDAFWFTAVFVDLEKGVVLPRQFRQSKRSNVGADMNEERKMDIRSQIGQSKAIRNAIIRALPSWLVDKAMARAKEGVRRSIETFIKNDGIEAARQLVMTTLEKYGISQAQVELKVGKKFAAWDVDILVLLKGDIRAITSGAESAFELYPRSDTKEVPMPEMTRVAQATHSEVDMVLDFIKDNEESLPAGTAEKYNADRLSKYSQEGLAEVMEVLQNEVSTEAGEPEGGEEEEKGSGDQGEIPLPEEGSSG
jgi:hypothetical protein